jgi:hypothetical protein
MAKEDGTTLRGDKTDVKEEPVKGPEEKKYRKRKELPSVAHLLSHGDPATAHLPKTRLEIFGYPFLMAALFAVSLLIWHHAPHDKSTHPGFKIPVPRPITMQKKPQPKVQYVEEMEPLEAEPIEKTEF